jgi:hypothetical protein
MIYLHVYILSMYFISILLLFYTNLKSKIFLLKICYKTFTKELKNLIVI